MKFRLLLFATFLTLMSCSGDDNSIDPVNENPIVEEPQSKNLLSIVITNESYKFVTNYEDNKIKDSYTYSSSGELLRSSTYTYLSNGTIGEIKIFDEQGNFTGISDVFLYDNEGKLVQIVLKAIDGEGVEVANYMDFIYNNDGTVTREYDFGGLTTTVYSFNNLGQLYKINSDGYESEATYEGNTIVSLYAGNLLSTYSYDTATLVKGHLLKKELNMFGGHYQNTALYFGFSAVMSFDKFCVESSNAIESETQATYEFDEDGYPIKITSFQDGVPSSPTIISYQ